MTTAPRPEEGGSGKGTPGDTRRPTAAWVKACRHLPVFEKAWRRAHVANHLRHKGIHLLHMEEARVPGTSESHTCHWRMYWPRRETDLTNGVCTRRSQSEHVLKLCEARASGQNSASKRGRQRTMSTNAYLSMKHDVAMQAANEIALKKCGQRIVRSAHFRQQW